MKTTKKLLVVLLIITLAFIWGNSLFTREYSTYESSFAVRVLEKFFGEGNVSEHLVRKLAHFTEFAVLGMELFGLFGRFPLAAAHGLFAAVTDESLQLITDRSAEVADILLDFSGVLFGALVILLICKARKKHEQQ